MSSANLIRVNIPSESARNREKCGDQPYQEPKTGAEKPGNKFEETSEKPNPSFFSLASYLASSKIRVMKKNPAAQALGKLGGKARAKALSESELSKIGRTGAEARKHKLTASQRSEIARKAAQARIAKYGQQQRKEK